MVDGWGITFFVLLFGHVPVGLNIGMINLSGVLVHDS